MKRFLLLSAMIVASVQLNASHLASELNLKLQQQAWFTLTLDNQQFNNPVNFFHTGELMPGNHYLQVTRLDHGYYGPYTVPVLVYNGYINIPARSRVHAFIDHHGQLRINKITALAPQFEPAPFYPECAPVPQPIHYGMSDHDFNQLLRTVGNLSFESSRIQVIKQALAVNQVTSHQVVELVNTMTFESGKLEVAKYAYHRTVDPQNYYIINDTFTFESSIGELADYISRS